MLINMWKYCFFARAYMFTQGITLSLQAITLSLNSIKLTSQHILVKMKCLHGKPCAHTKRISNCEGLFRRG